MYSDTALPRADGVAVALEALGTGLEDLGVQVEVVAPRQRYAGVLPYRQIPSLRFPGRDYRIGLVLPWAPYQKISVKGCDIVHIHTLGPIGLAGLAAANHAGIPAVLTWHTDLIAYGPYYPELRLGVMMAEATVRSLGHGSKGSLCFKGLKATIRNIFALVDMVIAPTLKVKRLLLEIGCSKPIAILPSPTLPLPPPIDNSDYLRDRLSISPDSPIILSVGRLSGEKNVDSLIHSFALLKKRDKTAHLILVGPTRNSQQLKSTAERLNVASAVHMPGTIERASLGGYYSLADLFVVPSRSETQCLAANEAEAFDLPVIVVDKGLISTFGQYPRILAEPRAEALCNVMVDHLYNFFPRMTRNYPTPEKFLPTSFSQSSKLLSIYYSV